MYEEQYLTSVDIVRDLLQASFSSSLLIADKRGSYDIYMSLVGTGVIGPADKLKYEEHYLTSEDIVRDLLQVSFSCFSTYSS